MFAFWYHKDGENEVFAVRETADKSQIDVAVWEGADDDYENNVTVHPATAALIEAFHNCGPRDKCRGALLEGGLLGTEAEASR